MTNSSSSSFILAFDSKEDGINKIAALTTRYGSDYICRLLNDFDKTEPFSREDLEQRYSEWLKREADYEICFGQRAKTYWGDEDSFEKRWMAAHPGATYRDFRGSEEYKAESRRLADELLSKMMSDVGDAGYLVELEYEDHSDVGSELEHNILPDFEFTVRRFSHH